jgi:hypothetical protein
MANTPLYIPVLEEENKFKDYREGVWGDSFNWWKIRDWDTIKYLVIHHSVTNPTNNPKDDVDYIAYLHKQRGWGGIGYHFVITADGTVWYVGDISTQRANVADKNHLVIGVCLVGDFTKTNPTDEQILSAHDLCKYLLFDVSAISNFKGWENLVGHSELQATQCPGDSWKGAGDSMYERIKNRIPYTPQPQPEPIINWEKRYKELVETNKEKEKILKEQISSLEKERDKYRGDLTKYKEECQSKIDELKENLENAKSENPKTPSIEEYNENEVLTQAVKIILGKLTDWLPKGGELNG